MNRWRVGEDRGSKEMDRCPLTITTIFPTTDLDEAHWILNMEIVHDQRAHTITLSQQHYVETILNCHGMSSC
jgi:hypothetical protein